MACQRCIEALESAGQVLQELQAFDRDSLPPNVDWAAVSSALIKLAGLLRIEVRNNDLYKSAEPEISPGSHNAP